MKNRLFRLVLVGTIVYGLGGCGVKGIGAQLLSGYLRLGSGGSLDSGIGGILSQFLGAAT